MTYRRIAVVVDESEASDVRLRLAMKLANDTRDERAEPTHITGIGLLDRPESFHSISDWGGASNPATSENIGDIGASDPAARHGEGFTAVEGVSVLELEQQDFHDATAGMPSDWTVIDSGDLDGLISHARMADLTILSQVDRAEGRRFPPERVILGSGGPVLIVPTRGAFEGFAERVLVAWDGSREAARALRDALPLLRRAKDVTVLEVGAARHPEASRSPTAETAAGYLLYHGIDAFPDEEIRGDFLVSEVLLTKVAVLGIDLLVSGSFHHSLTREALFGGVTRELLEGITVPMLMSH